MRQDLRVGIRKDGKMVRWIADWYLGSTKVRQVRLEPGAASTQTALYWIKSARSDFVEQCPFHSIHEYPTRSQERINLSHTPRTKRIRAVSS